jgi:hypothetical protein
VIPTVAGGPTVTSVTASVRPTAWMSGGRGGCSRSPIHSARTVSTSAMPRATTTKVTPLAPKDPPERYEPGDVDLAVRERPPAEAAERDEAAQGVHPHPEPAAITGIVRVQVASYEHRSQSREPRAWTSDQQGPSDHTRWRDQPGDHRAVTDRCPRRDQERHGHRRQRSVLPRTIPDLSATGARGARRRAAERRGRPTEDRDRAARRGGSSSVPSARLGTRRDRTDEDR